jgi:DNA invertase Pin-like site-specific DNA recombinase
MASSSLAHLRRSRSGRASRTPQRKLLRAYASEQGLKIVREYIDTETAEASGRTNFNAMIAHLRSHPAAATLLVEKTDRPYLNLRHWVTNDELDLEKTL